MAETAKKEKITVNVPIDPLNEKDTTLSVIINGKETKITRGEKKEVSADVYEVLERTGKI